MAGNEGSSEKIQQLQMLEQNIQQVSMQKQQFQTQLVEVDSAMKELKGTDEQYKIIGSIMVASDKADLEKELASKKEMLELRVKSVEKQEKQLMDKAESLREDVMSHMEGKDE